MSERSQFRLLAERRFGPFFGVQFMGAMNDNVFKQALVILLAFQTASFTAMSSDTLQNVAQALFILPQDSGARDSNGAVGLMAEPFHTQSRAATPCGEALSNDQARRRPAGCTRGGKPRWPARRGTRLARRLELAEKGL